MFSADTDIYAIILLIAVFSLILLNRRIARKKSRHQHDDDVNWL